MLCLLMLKHVLRVITTVI